MTVVVKPPLIDVNGIQSPHDLWAKGFALVPTSQVGPMTFQYDRRAVLGDILCGDHILALVYSHAGTFNPRYTKVTASGLLLHVILQSGTMIFHVINGHTSSTIVKLEVQGTIDSASDVLLSDTHIVYVNKWPSSRFSGVYIITFTYGDLAKQQPSASQRYFQVSTSARLSWADKALTLAMISVPGSSSIMFIDLDPGKTPQTIFPRLVFPDMDPNLHRNVGMLGELSMAYFGAEMGVNDPLFPSGNFCHTVADEVYQSTVTSLKWFNRPAERECTYIADGDFLYSLAMVGPQLRVSAAMVADDKYHDSTLSLSPLCSVDFLGRGSCFLDLTRSRVLNLGGGGPAAIFVIEGRVSGQDYLCYIWVTGGGTVKRDEFIGERAASMRPKHLCLAYAGDRASVVMTDKATYYIKR